MTPELRLLLACARVFPRREDEAAIRQILGDGIDWARLARKAVEFGLAGLAGHSLARVAPHMVPDDILQALHAIVEETRRKNQAWFNELADVIDVLANDGIEAIPFTGPILAIQAYRDLGFRTGELRLLVRDPDMVSTMETLSGLGYRREGNLTSAQNELIQRLQGQDTFVRAESGVVLVIHTRLTPQKMALDIDYAGWRRRATPTSVNGRTMMVLVPEDDLLVLAILGAKEMWWRVNRACDIAVFIEAHPNLDWFGTIERAREQGCLRLLLLATSLARRHFNAVTPEAIARAERDDPAIERMLQRVTARWLTDEAAGLPSFDTVLADRLLMHDGLARQARYVARTWFLPDPRHVAWIRLHRRLSWAYVPLKIAHDDILLPLWRGYRYVTTKPGRSKEGPAGTDDLAAFARPTQVVPPELERREQARADAVRALSSDAGNIAAWYDLAVSLLDLRRVNDAVNAFRAVVAIAPGNIRARRGLANALLQTSDRDGADVNEALSLFRLILAANADDAAAHFGLGRALQNLGRYGEAAASFRRCIALAPDLPAPMNALGELHRATGDQDAALAVWRQAMALAPDNVSILYNLTMAGKVRAAEPVLANLQALLEKERSLPSEARPQLHFALGKAYDDIGEPERGFLHVIEANNIRRQGLRYDEDKALALLEHIRGVFSADFFATARANGNSPDLPIFIVGMPRSGSSLIEQILASHPKVFGAGEHDEFASAMDRQLQRRGASLNRANLTAITSPAALRELGTRYVEYIRPLAPNAQRIVDKSLFNFCHAGLIHLALPNAAIIHCVRDPVDTCLSCFSHNFVSGGLFEFTYDLGELGRFYRAYTAHMAHWRSVLPAGAMIEVEYESLVRNFEPVARHILAHCGLE